ncbi:MAG TPA: ABC transporter permease subunit [Polyangiaceae bacterium]|nr:ABC transporter permease subunit [Polyangiaceae bacterium]
MDEESLERKGFDPSICPQDMRYCAPAMLRYALRRVLWAIPTLIATSLVLFFVTSLAPDPAALSDPSSAGGARRDEARRSRFLDLPRFLNTDPRDVRSRARDALSGLVAGDARQGAASDELCALGGAALPYVLPQLEALSPEGRGRVAVALAPVAVRMGLVDADRLSRPEEAVLFWTRFWENRALDFTRGAVDRGVLRLVEHESDLREQDLVVLDTFALPEIVGAMSATGDRVVLERLTRLAHRATGRGQVVAADATAGDGRRVVADWKEWWFVHGTDFVTLDGAGRAIAFVTDTRYGKWLDRARSGELGVSVIDGEPIAEKLRARAPVTMLVCALAMLASWALAVPLGALGAWLQGRAFDVASSVVLFVLYTTPTFAIAELLRRTAAGHSFEGARMALAVAALAAGSLATLSRWQRAAMLEVVRQDFVRTAHAKGLSAGRVAVVHALRNALLPMVTLAGLHLPTVLGGAFVVEEIFGLPGVGFETLRAIEAHDAGWLMAILLAAGVAITLGLVASDVACALLDPRVREVLAARQGGRA